MEKWSAAEQKIIDTIEAVGTIDQLEELRKMAKSELENNPDMEFVFSRICVELAKRRTAQIKTLWTDKD